MKKLLVLLLFSSFISSAQNIDRYKWILGKWEIDKNFFEEWKRLDDSTYAGRSYMVIGKKEKEFESIQLRIRNGVGYYVPTVKNQNDGKPVLFRITTFTDTSFTAEDPTHDFPQAIYYELRNATTLYARVDGKKKGKYKKEEFTMTKK